MRSVNSHVGSWAPMAEQKAVAKFLGQHDEVKKYLAHFRKEIDVRLSGIYDGFQELKAAGFAVDAITPQAAIYLTVQIDLKGKRTADIILENQADVTLFILNEAKLALVPFKAFGAGTDNSWYRLSVGCCKKEEIGTMLEKLRGALEKLR